MGLLGLEAHGAVESDDFAVEVAVLDDLLGELGVLVGVAEALGEGTVAARLSRIDAGAIIIGGVPIVPGAIVHTRTPIAERSRAAMIVMPITPAFAEP